MNIKYREDNQNYICKIASEEEIAKKFDYEIAKADDKGNWIKWKNDFLDRNNKGYSRTYIGVLNGEIICECTAGFDPSVIHDETDLVDEKTAYLYAFRTNEEYQGKGYFSKLLKYMLEDLKTNGYERATLGVEPIEVKNKEIYFKYGFTNHIKDSSETYPDGTKINVEYYSKNL